MGRAALIGHQKLCLHTSRGQLRGQPVAATTGLMLARAVRVSTHPWRRSLAVGFDVIAAHNQHTVASLHRHHDAVNCQGGAGADRAGQAAALGCPCLFGTGNQAAIDHFLREAMVTRELEQCPVAAQINPAVTHPKADGMALAQQEYAYGGARRAAGAGHFG